MNLGQILQKTTTDRYGERDTRYKGLLEEVVLSREGSGKTTGMPFILGRIPRGSKVLEFGPASGYMTRYLKEELECEVTIVELDPDCAASASVYADRCFIGNVDDLEWDEWLGSKKFDIITFCDVLEHLKEPWDILKRAASHLNKDGSVLCSIPNVAHHTVIAHLLENEFEYFSCGLLDITHVRFFTARSLKRLFDYCGLDVMSEGNTILSTIVSGSERPWEAGAKTPTAMVLQENLSRRAPYRVFQYVVELKHVFWMEENDTTGLDLCHEEQLVKETDFPGGEKLLEMEQTIQQLFCQKEELLQNREELLHEKDSLQEQLDGRTKELKARNDYLDNVLSSRGIKIWNRCVKLFSTLSILPSWRRSLRRKYSVK